MRNRILQFTEKFESILVTILLVMLMVVVLLGAAGLLALIVRTLIDRSQTTELSEMKFTLPLLHEVFSGFLMILIGLELMKTIVMYFDEHVVHVEVVLSVAMIAIARHVIDMDLMHSPPLSLIGTGIIVIALAAGYYYFKKASTLNLGPDGSRVNAGNSDK
jgi:uncharacterized membrane protein (DUF373 family)